MQGYHVVFDEAASGYREWWFPLCLFLAGLWIIVLRSALRYFNKSSADRFLSPWTVPFALLVGVGGSGFMLLQTYQPHTRLRDALRRESFQTVEGLITSVQSGDPGGLVITSADGVAHAYHYSEHRWTPGYRDANPTFRVGQRARVAEVAGFVARLEVSNESR